MTMIIRARMGLLVGCAALATFTAPVAAQDTAAPAAETASEDSGEILVTARRREERLIDVPVAVTAFNQDDLQRIQAIDLSGLQAAAPNLNLVQGRGSAASANIFIRGLGQPDALQTFDPAVGIYVDGVYLSRIQGALLNLFDVERIEVLRGPQGTLYGKNTTGGAISIVSRKPDLDTLKAAGSALYGSYNQIVLNGYLSAPLVTDKVALSLAGQWDKRDGLVTDPRTGREYNDRNSLTLRGILRIQPTERFEVIVSGDYNRQRNALTLGYPTAPLLRTNFALGAQTLVPAQPYGEYNFRASTSFTGNEGQRLDHWGVNLTANFELNDAITLTSITSWRKLDPDLFIDIDASQAQLGDVFVGIDQRQFSQELQLKWDNGSNFRGVFGLFYLNETIDSNQLAFANDLFALGALPLTFLRTINDTQNTKSYAAFGQATYDFTDRFSITAGLRYTKEERTYDRFTTTASTFAGLNNLTFRFPGSLPAPLNLDNDISFDAWTPSVTLSFKPSTNSQIYASASRGFKAGGFNGRANGVADLTQVVGGVNQLVTSFAPETVWTYETGAKASLLDGRIYLAGNVFYSDFRDFQARVGGGAVGVFPVLNAGKLSIWGAEVEMVVKPTKAWTVRSSLGYLNAQYEEFNDGRRAPAFSCNPTGTAITCEPAFAPPISFNIASDYRIDIGDAGSITLGADARFVDRHFLSVDNRPGLVEPGYWLANAFVRYDDASRRWYVQGGVKNLFDELYRTDGQEFSAVGNIQTVYFGDPQTWNIMVGFNF
jgi:iron complex outermembrane receptor protein